MGTNKFIALMLFLERNATRTRHDNNEDRYELEPGVSVYVTYQHRKHRIRVSGYDQATNIVEDLIGTHDFRQAKGNHKCWIFEDETWMK